jgi:hypothetical protein
MANIFLRMGKILSVRYCKIRVVSENVHTNLHLTLTVLQFAQCVSYLSNIHLFLITVKLRLKPIA